jgi:hypothetical protein
MPFVLALAAEVPDSGLALLLEAGHVGKILAVEASLH